MLVYSLELRWADIFGKSMVCVFQNERVTQPYFSGFLTYVFDTPDDDTQELNRMDAYNGMICLGTWENSITNILTSNWLERTSIH